MNIGLISKTEHVKSHLKALQQAGHQVSMLGGGPRVTILPSLDVLVVRPDSCAHRAYDAAMKEKRRSGGLPVVVANGITDILDQVGKIEKKRLAPARKKPGNHQKGGKTLEEWVMALVSACGVYGAKLHDPNLEGLIATLPPKAGRISAMGLWKESLEECKALSMATIIGTKWKGQSSLRTLYFVHGSKKNSVSSSRFVVNDEMAFLKVQRGLGFFLTHAEAKAEADSRREKLRAETARGAAPQKKVVPKVAAAPAPKVAPPVPVDDDPEGALKLALGMLLGEMRSLGIPRIVFTSDGVADYERTVVVKRSISVSE